MELDAMDRQLIVLKAHDRAVIGPGGNLQAGGEGFALDRQRVVAGGLKRAWQAAEHTLAVVVDGAQFAVHEFGCTHDTAAESLPERVMAETDAKPRQAAL